MFLVKRPLSLELARHDRADVLASIDQRAARVVAVSRLLREQDRRLVDLIFVRGATHRAAAAELGIAAGAVTRRVHRLRNLLASPTVRAIAEHVGTLAQPARQIAVDHFFGRMAVAALRAKHGMARRDVQAQLDYIRGWARALHRQGVLQASRAADASDE